MKVRISITFLVFLFCVQLIEGKTIFYSHACEGHSLKLSCWVGDKIRILEADYGRWNASVCEYYDDPNMILNCHSKHAMTIIKSKCNGHRSCKIVANNENFMDPCPGQVKYAEVKYICVTTPKVFKHHYNHHSNNYENEGE